MSNVSKVTTAKSTRICEYCDKEFPTPSALEIHQRVHTGERPFSCNLCDYSAATKDVLRNHIRNHLREKPFKCSELDCNYSSSQKGNVSLHHKIVHLGDKKLQCQISGCLYKTGHKGHLTLHMQTHEENPEKPFKCSLCPYKTTSPVYLKIHVTRIHSEGRNFKCSQQGCSHASKTKGDLNHHLETHGEKTLNCPHPDCEYKTNIKKCLNSHIKIHGSASDKKFKCRICDNSSHDLHNLTVHMRRHTKETPYKCKYDGYLYQAKASSTLNQHVKTVHEKI